MTKRLAERVIDGFGLTSDQRDAALERARDVVVTAGAGSGKTRTLVARYASLLADGLEPRRVVAITFTEKAAREMRSRVREALNRLAVNATEVEERLLWVRLEAQMDSARIGTIHSLCAEILRAHPAEAGLDPLFEVLDEGLTAVLRSQIITNTTQALVEIPEYAPLFKQFKSGGVLALLDFLLARRLEAAEAFEQTNNSRQVILTALAQVLARPQLAEPLAELQAIPPDQLRREAGDKLADMLTTLLALWHRAQTALAAEDPFTCVECLFSARRENMRLNIGPRNSPIKDILTDLRDAFDQYINPLTGGAGSQDTPPNRETEQLFEQLQPLLRNAFQTMLSSYLQALNQRQALDFDGMEDGALQLLRRIEIRARWQTEISALLVDEFQDTNARQREIVEALSGQPGRLFVVGDERQSIYRFRRADVTVFRQVQAQVRQRGGLPKNLDLTYRAHDPLLQTTAGLLEIIMGTTQDETRPFHVPFAALRANRSIPPNHILGPHVELILGSGEDTSSARQTSARALVQRLAELRQSGQIRAWDDVALLFRASSGFADYENAFEEAGIPFVTVAGRGFYDRPEIRDVLNLLRALSNPADDLAMAGLLRSPAFGLSDSALYLLRLQAGQWAPYRQALQGDLSMLAAPDLASAQRARVTLAALLPSVNRIPVAELLKRLVDATDYRALLAADETNGGGRLWRNLDKLLGDAQASRQVNVNEFLDYLATLGDAGAREGEAPAEAQGTVRLMTIHKSKGLEFPLVVLADAGREPRGGSNQAFLLPGLGLAFRMDPEPILFRLSGQLEKQQNQAETQRLLYVALTRAMDKLLISGHATPARSGSGFKLTGWMEALCTAANLNVESLLEQAGTPLETHTEAGHPLRAWCLPAETTPASVQNPARQGLLTSQAAPLYQPLFLPPADSSPEEDQNRPIWRATGTSRAVPHNVIGKMVHKALELWLFPGNPRLDHLLETSALNAGLASEQQRTAATHRAWKLLERLHAHPIWEEMDGATERHHEVPYSRLHDGHTETGYIDLLYYSASGWQVLDFKTDAIANPTERDRLTQQYRAQMQRYLGAVTNLTGSKAHARLCFLDDHGSISLVEV